MSKKFGTRKGTRFGYSLEITAFTVDDASNWVADAKKLVKWPTSGDERENGNANRGEAPKRVSTVYACQTARTKVMGFCDGSKSFVERASDLLQRLSTKEKLSLMGAHGPDICAFEDGGVPRLDIPSYTWCTETNTGVSSVCLQEGRCATTFPSPAALASSFNRSLWRRKGETQSTEQRALFNLGAVRGSRTHPLIGLNGWGPNINIVRGEQSCACSRSLLCVLHILSLLLLLVDPRYGRNSELPSEDTYLNGAYAIEVVRGMQEGDDPRWPLKIHTTLKHYTAYSVEANRFGFIGNASTYDVYDSFLPQYAAAFQLGHSAGVMCSYMSLRIADADAPTTQPPPPAHPSCASDFLLNQLVRKEWGQEDALIVTDCEATSSMYQHNHLAADCSDAAVSGSNEPSRTSSSCILLCIYLQLLLAHGLP